MNPLEQITIPLLRWYHEEGRSLPWRGSREPYRIWVSEVMLQQTRVAAVLDYYARFMKLFPTVEALAAAPEEVLMKAWEGLGYYSRARNLQKAARQIVEAGAFPTSFAGLRALSGIGDYTAAAIASIAYGLPYPAVDGNLLRVVARLTADGDDILSVAMKKKVTASLSAIIPLHQPGEFNQAMMDLGAMVCLPTGAPHCARCPLMEFCKAKALGRTAELPFRSPKKPRRLEMRAVFLLLYDGKVALRQRPKQGLLAGLWEFPNREQGSEPLGCALGQVSPDPAGQAKHIFTHIEWHMQAYYVEAARESLPAGWVWADAEALRERYALPAAFHGFLPLLEGRLR